MSRLVFFGNERLSTGFITTAPTLRALLAAGYDVVAVVSNYSQASSHSRNSRGLEIAEIAARNNIPLLLPDKPSDIIEQLRNFKADAGVLVAYGKIVPQSVINIFPRGIINIHPSLLPLHRGSTPVESVLLAGERQTGVSLMQLDKAMDAGPVYAQTQLLVESTADKQSLTESLLTLGSRMLVDLLPAILNGSKPPTVQDDTKATYDQLIQKSDGRIDLMKPAEQLEREIRAYASWPGSSTEIAGKLVIVTGASLVSEVIDDARPGTFSAQSKRLFMHCNPGTLEIIKLKPAGKTDMSAQAFLAGNSI